MGEPNLLVMDDRESGDALVLLLRRWYVIVFVAALFGGAAYFGSITWLPKTFESSGSVYIDRNSGLSSALSSLPISMSMSGGQGGYVVTLLQSDTMMRRIVTELDLSNDLNFTGKQPLSAERAQMQLKRSVNVKQDKNGAVTIVVRTGNADLASKIVNHMLNNLSQLFLTQSEKKTRFLSQKRAETEKQLALAEQAMLVFQTQHDITLIDDQTREIIRKLGDLDSQLIALDLQIQQTKSELTNQGELEELVKLKVHKSALEASRVVITSRIDQARRKLVGAPQISLEYARLQRNIGMLSKTVDLLSEQYQIATVTQHGNDADYQVVDWAQLREEPVGPRNAMNGALGAACGALLACLIVLNRRPKPVAKEVVEEVQEPVVKEKHVVKRKAVATEAPPTEVKPEVQDTPPAKETEE